MIELGNDEAPSLSFVVIGDSTSVGVGATRFEATYPWLLAEHLARSFRVRLTVVGRSGARIRDALDEFVDRAVEVRPELVLVGIGANDVTHLTPLWRFEKQLSRVIERLDSSGAKILVALGPRFDAPVIPRALRWFVKARARALNRSIQKVADNKGVWVLDLPSAIGDAFSLDRSLYCSDGFHPSDRGYLVWAEAMKSQVMEAGKASLES